MMYLVCFIVGVCAGFIAGALVYRNNQTKAEQVVSAGESVAEKAQELKDKVVK